MNYVGQRLYGFSGRQLGTVTDVMSDPVRMTPQWITVRRGLLRREHLIPASAIDERDGVLVTLLDDATIRHAPVTHDHIPPTPVESERIRAQMGLPALQLDHDSWVGEPPTGDSTGDMERPDIN